MAAQSLYHMQRTAPHSIMDKHEKRKNNFFYYVECLTLQWHSSVNIQMGRKKYANKTEILFTFAARNKFHSFMHRNSEQWIVLLGRIMRAADVR